MMSSTFVLALVCALLELAAGGAVRREPTIEDEIREWRRRGLPEIAAFTHIGNDTAEAHLTAIPPSFQSLALGKSNVANNIKYYMFTRENPSSGVIFTRNIEEVKSAGFNPKRLTKVIVHGFGNNIESDVFQFIIPNLLKQGDYNVIGVDWGKLCPKPFYVTARKNIKPVAVDLATTIEYLRENFAADLDDVHLIGHSLGAHVVGTCGKNVQSGQVARITGLDPAMPLFLILKGDRLKSSDAKLVDVIHTCAGFLGYEDPLGDVDFYPNGGTDPQPGCVLDVVGSCSHGRSYKYFAESILERNSFGSTQCGSDEEAIDQKCTAQNGKVTAHMGFNVKYKEPGVYSLKTESSEPYDVQFHEEEQ